MHHNQLGRRAWQQPGKAGTPAARGLVAALAMMLGGPATGADIEWINTAGGAFDDPANWSGNVVPGAGDSVTFSPTASHYTVIFDSDVTTDKVVVSADGEVIDFDLKGHTWTVNSANGPVGWDAVPASEPTTRFVGGTVNVAGQTILHSAFIDDGAVLLGGTDGVTSFRVAVTGVGSRWTLQRDLGLGYEGRANTSMLSKRYALEISAGGVVEADNAILTEGAGWSGLGTYDILPVNVAIAGAGSRLVLDGSLVMTEANEVLVSNNGRLEVAGALDFLAGGTIFVDGGELIAGGFGATNGSIAFDAGLVELAGDVVVGANRVLGPDLLLGAAHVLHIGGTTTIEAGRSVTLDGGAFRTGGIAGPGTLDFVSGRFELTAQDLVIGPGGPLGNTLSLSSAREIVVANDVVVAAGALLSPTGDGTLTAARIVNHGQVMLDGFASGLNVGRVVNEGLVLGNGRLVAELENGAAGEVRISTGQFVQFTGAANANDGALNVLGGTVEFGGGLVNGENGVIAGRGTLITGSGLDNRGRINLSGGITDVLGDVANLDSGRIIVSGGATATFFDDLVHNGSEIRVSVGSAAVYFGAVSGAGPFTGLGTNFFEGEFSPGNRPTVTRFDGDVAFGNDSTLLSELGGLAPGDTFDVVDVAGTARLGGTLKFALLDGYTPGAGDLYTFLLAGVAIEGAFDAIVLPHVAGLDFLLSHGDGALALQVVASAVPLPAGAWLLGAPLLVLLRRRHAASR
ncbi:MAG: hypothetical protein RLW62_09650 [Gammaproteobacteria bacterium]